MNYAWAQALNTSILFSSTLHCTDITTSMTD